MNQIRNQQNIILQSIMLWTTLKVSMEPAKAELLKMNMLSDIIAKEDLSNKLVARQRTVPKFFAKIVNKIARKEIIPPSGVIIKEGSKFSKGLTVLGGVVSIGFGIWDTIHGANKMKHGSKLSDEFRKVTNSLQKAQTKINEYYDIIK